MRFPSTPTPASRSAITTWQIAWSSIRSAPTGATTAVTSTAATPSAREPIWATGCGTSRPADRRLLRSGGAASGPHIVEQNVAVDHGFGLSGRDRVPADHQLRRTKLLLRTGGGYGSCEVTVLAAPRRRATPFGEGRVEGWRQRHRTSARSVGPPCPKGVAAVTNSTRCCYWSHRSRALPAGGPTSMLSPPTASSTRTGCASMPGGAARPARLRHPEQVPGHPRRLQGPAAHVQPGAVREAPGHALSPETGLPGEEANRAACLNQPPPCVHLSSPP